MNLARGDVPWLTTDQMVEVDWQESCARSERGEDYGRPSALPGETSR